MSFMNAIYKNLKFGKLMGICLFSLTYVFIGIQIYTIDIIKEDKKIENISYLYYLKSLAYTLISISILCHLRASFTDPGKIIHENNITFLDFYCSTRSLAVKRAEKFNQATKHLIRPPLDIDELDDYSDTEDDDNIYQESKIFTEEKIKEINKEFGYNLGQCYKCNVCRMPGVHHCSICEGCIYQNDHHCPWLNNCVGQFNQKFFIQFCFYSFLASLVCFFITFYYVTYRQPQLLTINFKISIFLLGQMILSFVSILLFGRLLYDQYDNITDMMNNYDPVKNKMIEQRNILEVLFEIFGNLPSIWWLLPIGKGGFYSRFKSIKSA